jgi:hypothetical protein
MIIFRNVVDYENASQMLTALIKNNYMTTWKFTRDIMKFFNEEVTLQNRKLIRESVILNF